MYSKRLDRWVGGWDGQTDRQTDRQKDGWADVRMDEWMNGGGLVRWMDEKNMINGTSSSTIP